MVAGSKKHMLFYHSFITEENYCFVILAKKRAEDNIRFQLNFNVGYHT